MYESGQIDEKRRQNRWKTKKMIEGPRDNHTVYSETKLDGSLIRCIIQFLYSSLDVGHWKGQCFKRFINRKFACRINYNLDDERPLSFVWDERQENFVETRARMESVKITTIIQSQLIHYISSPTRVICSTPGVI